MPIVLSDDEETRDALSSVSWVTGCRRATWRGKRMLLVDMGDGKGDCITTYVGMPLPGVRDSLEAFERQMDASLGFTSAKTIDEAITELEGFVTVEDVSLTVHEDTRHPQIQLLLPGTGVVRIDVSNGMQTLTASLRAERRRRRQDSEGRTLSELGAMTLALAASDHAQLDLVVDTVFHGAPVFFRDVKASLSKETITTQIEHKGVMFRSDGIEIPDLPDTVKESIQGRQRRHLRDVVSIAGFEDLDIVAINRTATNGRSTPHRGWIRLDVRDADGAKTAQVEIDEARAIAHRILDRRTSA